jgi:hypothetical protein
MDLEKIFGRMGLDEDESIRTTAKMIFLKYIEMKKNDPKIDTFNSNYEIVRWVYALWKRKLLTANINEFKLMNNYYNTTFECDFTCETMLKNFQDENTLKFCKWILEQKNIGIVNPVTYNTKKWIREKLKTIFSDTYEMDISNLSIEDMSGKIDLKNYTTSPKIICVCDKNCNYSLKSFNRIERIERNLKSFIYDNDLICTMEYILKFFNDPFDFLNKQLDYVKEKFIIDVIKERIDLDLVSEVENVNEFIMGHSVNIKENIYESNGFSCQIKIQTTRNVITYYFCSPVIPCEEEDGLSFKSKWTIWKYPYSDLVSHFV